MVALQVKTKKTLLKIPNDLGRPVFGIASIALGLVGLVFADFAAVWQPVPTTVPFRTVLAYLMAALLILSGASLFTRAARTGAATLIVLYLISALLWVPRIVSAPQAFGMWAGFAELFSLTAAAIALYASTTPSSTQLLRFACRAFGVCAIAFGGAHFSAVNETAAMVPSYFPFGQKFWAVATGVGHLLAGIAIVTGVRAQLAARLLIAMCIVFLVLVWIPMLMNGPVPHMTWAGNAITLTLIGAAWVVGDLVGGSAKSRLR